MENEEQPTTELSKEERIEAHFSTENEDWNDFTYELYKDVTENGVFDDVEVPLAAFNNAKNFLYTNCKKPLSAVKALINHFDEQDPPFTDGQKQLLLTYLSSYFSKTVYRDEVGKEIFLNKIVDLLRIQEDSLQESEVDIPNDNEFDWNTTKKHLEGLIDTTAKIGYLIERKADFEQQDDGWNPPGPTYAEQCDIEIKKLDKLAALEQIRKSTASPFRLSSKHGAKTNMIRLLNALYELDLIKLTNGQPPTKEQFMQQVGNFLGVDMTRYEQVLSKALEQPLEANMGILEELRNVIQALVLARLEGGRK